MKSFKNRAEGKNLSVLYEVVSFIFSPFSEDCGRPRGAREVRDFSHTQVSHIQRLGGAELRLLVRKAIAKTFFIGESFFIVFFVAHFHPF